MSKKIAILYGHPDASPDRLCHALSKAYQDGAQLSGHPVRRIDVSELNFESVKSSADFRTQETPKDINSAQETIKWADHLLFIFPLWMGSTPGLYKMFLEQVFRPGFAIDYSKKGFPGQLLKGTSADIVVTMSMPTVAYEGFYFSHGIRNLKRNILHFCGIKPTRITYVGGVDHLTTKDMIKWQKRMAHLGSHPG